MNTNKDQDVAATDDSASPKKGQNRILLFGPVIIAVLLLCVCIQLVLNGIIVEPETLIIQIGEFLFGRRSHPRGIAVSNNCFHIFSFQG